VITRHSGFGRLYSLLAAGVFAIAFYGIHRRFPIAWKIGWGVLIASFLDFLVSALSFSLRLPLPDRLIASSAIIVGGCAVAIYWGFWWNRQKSYFTSTHDQVA
jgi:hypothetical protein